jgi:hypothetical protein
MVMISPEMKGSRALAALLKKGMGVRIYDQQHRRSACEINRGVLGEVREGGLGGGGAGGELLDQRRAGGEHELGSATDHLSSTRI